MYLTYLDILTSLNINIEQYNETELLYKKSKILNDTYESITEIKAKQKKIDNLYTPYVEKLSKYYFNVIYKDGYCISVEDIALHLNVSIQFVKETVIKFLDRIEFPKSNYEMKVAIRNNIKNKFDNINTDTIYGVVKSKELKNHFKDRFRKKVLYSKSSYIQFLKNHMELIENNAALTLTIDSEIFLKTYNRLVATDMDYTHFIRLLFNNYLKSNKKVIENCKSNIIFDFETMIESKFNILSSKYKFSSYADFKSMAYLKTVFNKIYDSEIYRLLDNSCHNYMSFTLTVNNSKKPVKRYLLDNDFIIEKFKETIEGNSTSEKLNYNINTHSYNFRINIPKKFYRSYFNENPVLLSKEFTKYIIKKRKLKTN